MSNSSSNKKIMPSERCGVAIPVVGVGSVGIEVVASGVSKRLFKISVMYDSTKDAPDLLSMKPLSVEFVVTLRLT